MHPAGPSHRARRRFGQNFLHDASVIRSIARSVAPGTDDHLVEIGPGQGAITEELAESCARLDLIELDRDLVSHLKIRFATYKHLHIHSMDALNMEFCSLVEHQEKLRVVGNLPYNISTPLLFHLLEQSDCISDMHFMLQKEVVKRMAASPGSGAYGRLSIMLQIRCEVIPLFEIPPTAFQPQPKVDSGFVRLVPHTKPRYEITDMEALERIVRQSFMQRRKTLANNLKKTIGREQIEACGIDPSLRPERLEIADFVRLANSQV